MAPHENLFFVEKHYNDSLYRGQRKGTTHTDREIQAAANLLGRRGVVADERTALATRRAREHDQRIERVRASGESLRGGDVVILGMGGGGRAGATSGDDGGGGKRATREWDGCVARIDVANLAAGRHGTTNSRRKRGEDESSRPVQKLDAGNRWKTEARIAAGGTGGSAELERARRAAHALDGGTDAGDGSNRGARSNRPIIPIIPVIQTTTTTTRPWWCYPRISSSATTGGRAAAAAPTGFDPATSRFHETPPSSARYPSRRRARLWSGWTRRRSIDRRRRRRRRGWRSGMPRDAGSWRRRSPNDGTSRRRVMGRDERGFDSWEEEEDEEGSEERREKSSSFGVLRRRRRRRRRVVGRLASVDRRVYRRLELMSS